MLPPVDAEALVEPTTDTPTQALDAAEIAALLRAGREEPEVVLPSQPAIPAAEAELALGAVPSPATSPIDAESIAAASYPEPFDAAPADAEPGETDEHEADGLAALFGDVGEEQEVHEPEPEPEDEAEAEDDRFRPEPEPAADLEGPQLPATVAFSLPPTAAEDSETFDRYGRTAPPVFTPLATGAAAVPAPTAELPPVTATAAPASAVPAAPAASAVPAAPAGPVPPQGTGGSGLWGNRNNRILLLALSALAVVLVLIGLFALGTRIPSLVGGQKPAPQPTTVATATAAKPSASPTAAPVPTVTPKPAAAVGPGVHPWDALGGGECIQPFTSVWAEEFTVVDCAAPHTAQLLYTNVLSADPAAPYPGADALAQQMPGVCTAGGIVDLAAAGAYPDLQVIGSYPATEQQWKDGQRSYYCFANRASGQPLTSSVAGPGPS
ncbi:hypothetical protein [Leifsonia xyli]|uniref:hypothetical protein n=1 Tax=Leifsonia xyli TaxID=1575 RepID=UPI003D667633